MINIWYVIDLEEYTIWQASCGTACNNWWRTFDWKTYGPFPQSSFIYLFEYCPGMLSNYHVSKLDVGLPLSLYNLFPYLLDWFSQAAAQLLSASMIIYAHSVPHSSTSSMLLRPWFIVLVLAGAVERLFGVATGVAMERDWVVLVVLFFTFLFP